MGNGKKISTHIGVKLHSSPCANNIISGYGYEQWVRVKMNMYESAISMDLLTSGTRANYEVQELSDYDVKRVWLGLRLAFI